MKRAQVSVEYILILGVILLTFVLIFLFHSVKNVELRKSEDFLEKRSECLKIADTIAEVYTNEGSSVNLSLRYDVSVDSSSNDLYVNDVYCSMPIRAVYDDKSNQEFNMGKGSVLFQNVNNSVIITTIGIPPLPPTPACSSLKTCSGCTANGCEWWDPWLFGSPECKISCQGSWFGTCYDETCCFEYTECDACLVESCEWWDPVTGSSSCELSCGEWSFGDCYDETCPQDCSVYTNCFDCIANNCEWFDVLGGSCQTSCSGSKCYEDYCPCSIYMTCNDCISTGCKWCQKGTGSCGGSCSTGSFGNCIGGTCYTKSCP